MSFQVQRKWIKTGGIIAAILVLGLAVFHFWFVHHARDVIEDIVSSKSNGKLKLRIGKFRFNYISHRMDIHKAVFYTNDTAQSDRYRFSIVHLKVEVSAFWPLLLQNQLLIDSVTLSAPHVQMTRLKRNEKENGDISISEEIGRVYNSIQDALQVLQVKNFQLNNGRFTLINGLQPAQPPTTISNIQFHIDNLRIDPGKEVKSQKILFSDNIMLRTTNQDIQFPDGRHRLAFSSFRINILKKIIEIDSCTITAKDTVSGKASSTVFIDTLTLSDIDFNALYRQQLIKVDSVYCANPRINLVLELKDKDTAKKSLPDLGKVVQELTGRMELGLVIMKNAELNITTIRNEKSSTFAADKNDFKLQGLLVDPSRENGVSVKGFAAAIRNYENFLKDSSYAIRFDSILFVKNKVQLRNFSMIAKEGGQRSFFMPLFELNGLSWNEALFNRQFVANRATFYQPQIYYTKPEVRRTKKKQTFFQLLASIHNIMQLDGLNVVDGHIKLNLGKGTEVELRNTYLQVQTDAMTGSSQLSGIKNSVEDLRFSNGLIKVKEVTAALQGVHFTGKQQQLQVNQLKLTHRHKNLSALVKNLLLNELVVDEETDLITADGLQWKEADITIRSKGKKGAGESAVFLLKNITSANTRLHFFAPAVQAHTHLQTIQVTGLRNEKNKIKFTGFHTRGRSLELYNTSSTATAKGFGFNHNERSWLTQFSFHQHKGADTIAILSPDVDFVANLENLINQKLVFDNLVVSNPVINLSFTNNNKEEKKSFLLPEAFIQNFRINNPDVTIKTVAKNSSSSIRWSKENRPSGKSLVHLQNIRLSPPDKKIGIDKIMIAARNFRFANSTGRTVGNDSSYLQLNLQNTLVQRGGDNEWDWSTKISEAATGNVIIDSLGKDRDQLLISTAGLTNLTLKNTSFKDVAKTLTANPNFSAHHISGKYKDKNNEFGWYNVSFSQPRSTLSLDSFTYKPAADREAFIAQNRYQTTYLTASTGPIVIKEIDLKKYMNDSTINIKTIHINNPVITSYRDKRPPFNENVFRPLPVVMLKNMATFFSIDTITLSHGQINYTELNNKTGLEGNVFLTRIDAELFPVRNYNLREKDSLGVRAEGYLMDSAWMRLRMKESYTDSLAGFSLTLRLRPSSLTFLNPALEPLTSVRLKSGYLDTLSMRAVGRNHLSLGEMQMFYHDLRVQFLKKGDETKKNMIMDLATFVANNFVIKKENRSRTGLVYFPRLQNRSIFNYLVKITLSGMASSVGARHNKKMLRQYKRQLKTYNLPPVYLD